MLASCTPKVLNELCFLLKTRSLSVPRPSCPFFLTPHSSPVSPSLSLGEIRFSRSFQVPVLLISVGMAWLFILHRISSTKSKFHTNMAEGPETCCLQRFFVRHRNVTQLQREIHPAVSLHPHGTSRASAVHETLYPGCEVEGII